jgi:uncharacterized protein YndB with AHSA1/START domain
MAKKSNNKKVSVKKKKTVAKRSPAPNKKKAVAKKKSAKAPIKKKAAKVSKAKSIKKVTKKVNVKPAKKVETKKPAKKETPPKKAEKIIAPISVKVATPVVQVKKEKPAKVKKEKPPKEKKIIKAPIIIPNQRIGEKALVTTSKKAEPKGKFELEFVVRSSPVVLFELLSTPSGLSEWFADDVNIRDDVFTFLWDGTPQSARVLGLKENEYIRFQWVDKKDGSYFEFRLQIDELTSDVSLIITDFAENDSEKASSSLLWESQVNKMLHVLGSYY